MSDADDSFIVSENDKSGASDTEGSGGIDGWDSDYAPSGSEDAEDEEDAEDAADAEDDADDADDAEEEDDADDDAEDDAEEDADADTDDDVVVVDTDDDEDDDDAAIRVCAGAHVTANACRTPVYEDPGYQGTPLEVPGTLACAECARAEHTAVCDICLRLPVHVRVCTRRACARTVCLRCYRANRMADDGCVFCGNTRRGRLEPYRACARLQRFVDGHEYRCRHCKHTVRAQRLEVHVTARCRRAPASVRRAVERDARDARRSRSARTGRLETLCGADGADHANAVPSAKRMRADRALDVLERDQAHVAQRVYARARERSELHEPAGAETGVHSVWGDECEQI